MLYAGPYWFSIIYMVVHMLFVRLLPSGSVLCQLDSLAHLSFRIITSGSLFPSPRGLGRPSQAGRDTLLGGLRLSRAYRQHNTPWSSCGFLVSLMFEPLKAQPVLGHLYAEGLSTASDTEQALGGGCQPMDKMNKQALARSSVEEGCLPLWLFH